MAIAIVGANFPDPKLAAAAVCLYLLVSIVGTIPYTLWRKHHDGGHLPAPAGVTLWTLVPISRDGVALQVCGETTTPGVGACGRISPHYGLFSALLAGGLCLAFLSMA
ncbi:MAG: hypothetical protein WDM81_02385 [Rhizomicrobium sp.]